ncbi:transposase [Vibrio aestuarianus]|nr:transposase [Vibrio aestuarianus]
MVEDGYTNQQIQDISGACSSAVVRWKRQYKEEMLGMTPTNRVALTPEQQRIQELEKQLARAKRDRAMLSKRFIIETINDQLKNISQIEHSRHRSLHGFMLNLLGGLIAYCLKPEKPSLNITTTEKSGLMAMA